MAMSEWNDASVEPTDRVLADGRILPDDFEPEDVAFAHFLSGHFDIEGENLPPRYAQTLLGNPLYGPVADDFAELNPTEEVLVGLGDLTQDWIGLHVLNVGFEERSTVLDGLDDLFLTEDGLVDQRVLASGELARGQDVLILLLLADKRESREGGKGDGDEECER